MTVNLQQIDKVPVNIPGNQGNHKLKTYNRLTHIQKIKIKKEKD